MTRHKYTKSLWVREMVSQDRMAPPARKHLNCFTKQGPNKEKAGPEVGVPIPLPGRWKAPPGEINKGINQIRPIPKPSLFHWNKTYKKSPLLFRRGLLRTVNSG